MTGRLFISSECLEQKKILQQNPKYDVASVSLVTIVAGLIYETVVQSVFDSSEGKKLIAKFLKKD